VADAIEQCVIGTKALKRAGELSVPRACAAPLLSEPDTLIQQLLILNIVLQIFDGVATYAGLRIGIHEGNPLLRDALHVWGIVPALFLFKAEACGLLVLVYRMAGADLAVFAFGLLAAAYCTFSLIPWLSVFVTFFLPSI
jgi:hypothetical protein